MTKSESSDTGGPDVNTVSGRVHDSTAGDWDQASLPSPYHAGLARQRLRCLAAFRASPMLCPLRFRVQVRRVPEVTSSPNLGPLKGRASAELDGARFHASGSSKPYRLVGVQSAGLPFAGGRRWQFLWCGADGVADRACCRLSQADGVVIHRLRRPRYHCSHSRGVCGGRSACRRVARSRRMGPWLSSSCRVVRSTGGLQVSGVAVGRAVVGQCRHR